MIHYIILSVHKGHLCVVKLIDLECLPILIASIKPNTTIGKFIFALTGNHIEYSGRYIWCVYHIDGKCGQQGGLG